MLQIQVRDDKLEKQSFLGGELYYNTKIKEAQQTAFTHILKGYFAKLSQALKDNKNEHDIVQEVLKGEFFEKFKAFSALTPYEDGELSAGHKFFGKQDTAEKKIQGAVDFVLKKDGDIAVLFEAKNFFCKQRLVYNATI